MKLSVSRLQILLADVLERNPEPRSPYTNGYIDCLRYLIDWLEEDE